MDNDFLKNLSNVFIKVARFFVKLALFFVIIYLIGIRLFDFGHRLFYERAISDGEGEEIVFEIKKGETVDEIANHLVEKGLIDDKLVFKFRAKIYETEFTPNVYNLKTSMTIKNMLDIFDSPTEEDLATTIAIQDVYQLSPEDDDGEIDEIENE